MEADCKPRMDAIEDDAQASDERGDYINMAADVTAESTFKTVWDPEVRPQTTTSFEGRRWASADTMHSAAQAKLSLAFNSSERRFHLSGRARAIRRQMSAIG